MPDVCISCRKTFKGQGRYPSCDDEEKICSKTGMGVDNETYFMGINYAERMVAGIWGDVIAISPYERIKKKGSKKDEVVEISIPSMSNMDTILNNLDFGSLPFNKEDLIQYLINFHISYINNFIG